MPRAAIDDFQRWLDEPSPLDLWVYRGQAARYDTILPSNVRPGNRRFLGNRLHHVDPRVAHALLTSSPVLQPAHLLPGLSEALDLDREGFYSYVTGRPGEASFSRIIRALAQHYGFPTLFVDLTLDPWVAAAFAVHSRAGNGYVLRAGPGRIYRWPARRCGDTLLAAAGRGRAVAVDLIDLSRMSGHLRRPTNQASVLALPVEVPSLNPSSFSTPGVARAFPLREGDLDIVDLARAPLVESFEVSPEFVEEPLHGRGVSMEALFPDVLDLGHSYMVMIALLSLITVHPEPEQTEGSEGHRATCRQHASSVAAAAAILERECYRLVPGTPLGSDAARKLLPARQEIECQVELALQATEQILAGDHADEARREFRRARRNLAFAMVAELLGADGTAQMRAALAPDQIPYFDYSRRSFIPVELKMDPAGSDWLAGEIRDRSARAEALVDRAGLLPAHALNDRAASQRLREVFPTDPGYERTVARQVKAVRRLRPDRPVFPGRGTREDA